MSDVAAGPAAADAPALPTPAAPVASDGLRRIAALFIKPDGTCSCYPSQGAATADGSRGPAAAEAVAAGDIHASDHKPALVHLDGAVVKCAGRPRGISIACGPHGTPPDKRSGLRAPGVWRTASSGSHKVGGLAHVYGAVQAAAPTEPDAAPAAGAATRWRRWRLGDVLATLPEGYRPANDVEGAEELYNVAGLGDVARGEVSAEVVVSVRGGSGDVVLEWPLEAPAWMRWISLNSITVHCHDGRDGDSGVARQLWLAHWNVRPAGGAPPQRADSAPAQRSTPSPSVTTARAAAGAGAGSALGQTVAASRAWAPTWWEGYVDGNTTWAHLRGAVIKASGTLWECGDALARLPRRARPARLAAVRIIVEWPGAEVGAPRTFSIAAAHVEPSGWIRVAHVTNATDTPLRGGAAAVGASRSSGALSVPGPGLASSGAAKVWLSHVAVKARGAGGDAIGPDSGYNDSCFAAAKVWSSEPRMRRHSSRVAALYGPASVLASGRVAAYLPEGSRPHDTVVVPVCVADGGQAAATTQEYYGTTYPSTAAASLVGGPWTMASTADTVDVTFVRHAQALHNVLPKGSVKMRDPSLTDRGFATAHAAAADASGFASRDYDVLVVSPMQRTLETAATAFKSHIARCKEQVLSSPVRRDASLAAPVTVVQPLCSEVMRASRGKGKATVCNVGRRFTELPAPLQAEFGFLSAADGAHGGDSSAAAGGGADSEARPAPGGTPRKWPHSPRWRGGATDFPPRLADDWFLLAGADLAPEKTAHVDARCLDFEAWLEALPCAVTPHKSAPDGSLRVAVVTHGDFLARLLGRKGVHNLEAVRMSVPRWRSGALR